MRKLVIIAIVTMAALSAIASGMATAALPEWLPDDNTFPIDYTGFVGPSTFAITGGNTIECKKAKERGEVLSAKVVDLTMDLEECTISGIIDAHSLGDPANVILVTSTGELCYINKATKEVGLVSEPTGKVHIEAAGQLAVISGSVIGVGAPDNKLELTFTWLFKAKETGVQEQLKCEGGAETHLTGSENEGSEKAASLVLHEKKNFLRTSLELMA
jgi:hypothetical protein